MWKLKLIFWGIKITGRWFFIIQEKRLIIPYVNYVKTTHFWGFFLIQTSASIFLFQFCYHSNRIYKTLMVNIVTEISFPIADDKKKNLACKKSLSFNIKFGVTLCLTMLKYPCILRPFFLKGFTHPDHNRPRVIIWLWWCQIPLVLSATRFFEKPTKRAPRFGFMSSSLGPRPLFVRSDIRASWLRGLWERRDALLSLCVQWWG